MNMNLPVCYRYIDYQDELFFAFSPSENSNKMPIFTLSFFLSLSMSTLFSFSFSISLSALSSTTTKKTTHRLLTRDSRGSPMRCAPLSSCTCPRRTCLRSRMCTAMCLIPTSLLSRLAPQLLSHHSFQVWALHLA